MKEAYTTILKIMYEEMKQNDNCLYKNILRDIRFRMQIEETFSAAIMCFSKEIEHNLSEQNDESIIIKLENLYIKVSTVLSCIA